MALGNNYNRVPSDAPSVSDNGRSMEDNKTLEQIRTEREKAINDIRVNNLQQYARLSKDLQKELSKIEREDAEELNAYKESLEKKYSDLLKKDGSNNFDVQKKIARRLADYNRQLNKEAAQRNLKDRTKDYELIKKERKKLRSDLDKTEKQAYKTQIKQYKEDMKKARKEIMASSDTKREGWQKRVEANPKDYGAQFGLTMTKALDATFSNITDTLLNDLKNLFESSVEDYAEYQSKVNVRLQGSKYTWQGGGGSIGLQSKLTNTIGVNALVRLQDVFDNVVTATEQGIAFNVEQRAFLNTIKDEIAATFDAFDSNLMRIIRLQQQDSTAARLGLEAALTTYLNANFQDSSYMSQAFDSVSQGLTEAIAQVGTEAGIEFEYQVQKWLGALYSVGFSSGAVSNIASAIGMIGSGDVSGLASNSAMQNLLVMAASRAGLSYADLLTGGLTAEDTNTLLQSMVAYLQEIAESDNKVVKTQFAQVFGLTASDLKAATNLGDILGNIGQIGMNYSSSIGELNEQMNQLYSRISLAKLLKNARDNLITSLGQGIADNPVTYALWEITSLIEGLTGGINLPTVSVLGNSVDLETTVTNLMRLGIVGVSTLGQMGAIVNGVSSSINPASMLSKLGIGNSPDSIVRGSGLAAGTKIYGDVSSSTDVGNTSGQDIYDSTIADADSQVDSTLDTAREESADLSVNAIHEYLLQVFDPKITDIERMLAAVSGYKISRTSSWGDFTSMYVDEGSKYNATQVTIATSENSMAAKNAENIANISTMVTAIYLLLRSGISVSVSNYGLIGSSNRSAGVGAVIPGAVGAGGF